MRAIFPDRRNFVEQPAMIAACLAAMAGSALAKPAGRAGERDASFGKDGKPDPTFGTGGLLITDLGLGNPAAPGGTYSGPSIGIRSVVIDSQDRIVLSGGYVTELANCRDRRPVLLGGRRTGAAADGLQRQRQPELRVRLVQLPDAEDGRPDRDDGHAHRQDPAARRRTA